MLEARANWTLEEMDKASLLHPNTSIAQHLLKGPTIVGRGSGVRIRDHRGRDYIDCGAGLWCVNIGYGRSEIAEAARAAIEKLSYYHLFGSASNEPMIRLADRVLTLFREKAGVRGLSKVFFGTSGSDANDTNFKLVRYYNNLRGKPEKKKILARRGGYHGLTVASGSLTGIPVYHEAFDLPLPGVIHLSCPHAYRFARPGESEQAFCDRLVAELETVIEREGPETVAAFIGEPIMGTGGVLMPPADYWPRVQEICRKNDMLLIVDEVITGFGRTGQWFASGLYGLEPDIVTLAKGITSAYFPVSASVISERIFEVLEKASPERGPVMHGFTYSGHPVGGAIGLVNLDIMEREGMVENGARVGPFFKRRLEERIGDHPFVGEIRGVGMLNAVEFVADKATRRPFRPEQGAHRVVGAKAIEAGVMVRPLPFIEVIPFSPPLCMREEEAEEAVDRFARALDAATDELARLARA
jgi:L-2,4-diaminobutyrate transaminase